jgi:hypothetical protein
MTATVTTAPLTTDTAAVAPPRPALWKGALGSGLVAAVATITTAAVASGLGVSLEIAGEAIPVAGFGTVTLMCVTAGYLVALAVRRFSSRPATTWVRVAVVLTALSFVPDLTADATTATKLTLMLTHVIAAAIVIPVIARRLPA